MNPGDQVTKYRLVERLGAGGMGEVWKAIDPALANREVAIKVVRGGLDIHHLMALAVEARTLARIPHHPNLVVLYDVIEEGDQLALVMEYIEGPSLAALIASHPSGIPWPMAIPLIRGLLAGMDHAHRHRVIHRDLKPDNIRIAAQESASRIDASDVRIMDFGLARTEQLYGTTYTRGTGGTLAYMSPEQINAQSQGPFTDVYALGILIYEILTGHPPFRITSLGGLIQAHCEGQPAPPSQHCPDLSPDLDRAILKALAKPPRERYPDAGALAQALIPLLEIAASRRGAAPDRRKRQRCWVTAGGLGLSLMAVLTMGSRQGSFRKDTGIPASTGPDRPLAEPRNSPPGRTSKILFEDSFDYSVAPQDGTPAWGIPFRSGWYPEANTRQELSRLVQDPDAHPILSIRGPGKALRIEYPCSHAEASLLPPGSLPPGAQRGSEEILLPKGCTLPSDRLPFVYNGRRAELSLEPARIPGGLDVTYAFDMYLPKEGIDPADEAFVLEDGTQVTGRGDVFAQWQNHWKIQEVDMPTPIMIYPPLALGMHLQHYTIAHYAYDGMKKAWTWVPPRKLAPIAPDKGKWTAWKIRIAWGAEKTTTDARGRVVGCPDRKAILEVFKDDKLLYTTTQGRGAPNFINPSPQYFQDPHAIWDPYFTLGISNSWLPGARMKHSDDALQRQKYRLGSHSVHKRVVYFDNVRVMETE